MHNTPPAPPIVIKTIHVEHTGHCWHAWATGFHGQCVGNDRLGTISELVDKILRAARLFGRVQLANSVGIDTNAGAPQ